MKFYSRWCRCLWSLTWLLSFRPPSPLSQSQLSFLSAHSLTTSHPSSLTIATCIFFAPFPVSLSLSLSSLLFSCQTFSLSTQRDVAIQQTVHHFSLTPKCTCPPPFSSFLFHFFSSSLYFDSTRRPLHAIEMNSRLSLYVHSIVLFTFSLSLWGERVSLTRKLLSFNLTQQTLTNTFSYMKYRHTQTPLLLYSLFLSLILTLTLPLVSLSFPSRLFLYLSPSLCVIIPPF